MEKQAWKEFYTWLETASEQELLEKRSSIEALQPKLILNAEIYQDSARMIKNIDLELLNRCF